MCLAILGVERPGISLGLVDVKLEEREEGLQSDDGCQMVAKRVGDLLNVGDKRNADRCRGIDCLVAVEGFSNQERRS